jgi:hypothetical protein
MNLWIEAVGWSGAHADPCGVWMNPRGEARGALHGLSTDEYSGGGGIHCEQRMERRTAICRRVAMHRPMRTAALSSG